MAFPMPETETPEQEQARIDKSAVMWLGGIAAQLKELKFEKIHERLFAEQMDRQLNMSRTLPAKAEVERLKSLAWKYRRQMPQHSRLKLPPHDPIVQEMEAQRG